MNLLISQASRIFSDIFRDLSKSSALEGEARCMLDTIVASSGSISECIIVRKLVKLVNSVVKELKCVYALSPAASSVSKCRGLILASSPMSAAGGLVSRSISDVSRARRH
jgi:hypothetical protein